MATSHDLLPPPPGMVHTYVFLSDIHSVHSDQKALDLVFSFLQLVPIKQRKIILGGDILDIGFIYSKCEKFKHNIRQGNWDDYFIPELDKEVKWFNEFYSKIRSLVLYDEDIRFIEGNHCERLRRRMFIDMVPFEYKRYFSLNNVLKSEQRNLQIIPYHDWYRISAIGMADLYLGHGFYCTQNAVKKHALEVPGAVIFGHTHQITAYSEKRLDNTVISYNNPCLCRMDMSYLEGRITNWAQGFSIINTDGICYWVVTLRIINGELILPTGEKIKSSI